MFTIIRKDLLDKYRNESLEMAKHIAEIEKIVSLKRAKGFTREEYDNACEQFKQSMKDTYDACISDQRGTILKLSNQILQLEYENKYLTARKKKAKVTKKK